MKGQAHIWIVMDDKVRAVGVTQIKEIPKLRYLLLWLYAGDKVYQEDFLKIVENWAKKRFGCTYTETWTRPGLIKTFYSKHGFKQHEVKCTREII